MAYRVELSRRAERDLDNIYAAINAASHQSAAAWFNGLEAAVRDLNLFPRRNSAAREGSNLLQMPYGRSPNVYRILYAVDEERQLVSVATIRHAARDDWDPARDGA